MHSVPALGGRPDCQQKLGACHTVNSSWDPATLSTALGTLPHCQQPLGLCHTVTIVLLWYQIAKTILAVIAHTQILKAVVVLSAVSSQRVHPLLLDLHYVQNTHAGSTLTACWLDACRCNVLSLCTTQATWQDNMLLEGPHLYAYVDSAGVM